MTDGKGFRSDRQRVLRRRELLVGYLEVVLNGVG